MNKKQINDFYKKDLKDISEHKSVSLLVLILSSTYYILYYPLVKFIDFVNFTSDLNISTRVFAIMYLIALVLIITSLFIYQHKKHQENLLHKRLEKARSDEGIDLKDLHLESKVKNESIFTHYVLNIVLIFFLAIGIPYSLIKRGVNYVYPIIINGIREEQIKDTEQNAQILLEQKEVPSY